MNADEGSQYALCAGYFPANGIGLRVFALREVVNQFEKIGLEQFAVALGRVVGALLKIVFEQVNEGVEWFAQNLVALAVEPAHRHGVADGAAELIAQAAFPDTGFAENEGYATKTPVAQGRSEILQGFEFGGAAIVFTAERGAAAEVAPAEQVGGDFVFKPLVALLAPEHEFEIPVVLHVVVGHYFAPVGFGHEACCQIHAGTHSGILATLGAPDNAGKRQTRRDTDSVTGTGQRFQVLEFFLNGGDKFKRALRVVFKRNRRAEQATDDGAFVAKVNFLEIAAEVQALVEHDGSEMVERLVGIYPGKRQEHTHHIAELAGVTFGKSLFR